MPDNISKQIDDVIAAAQYSEAGGMVVRTLITAEDAAVALEAARKIQPLLEKIHSTKFYKASFNAHMVLGAALTSDVSQVRAEAVRAIQEGKFYPAPRNGLRVMAVKAAMKNDREDVQREVLPLLASLKSDNVGAYNLCLKDIGKDMLPVIGAEIKATRLLVPAPPAQIDWKRACSKQNPGGFDLD